MTFLPSKGQGNNYPVPVDSFAQKVTAVAFFGTGGQSDITLDGPDGHPVDLGEIQQFLDRHYVIDSLDTSTSNVVHGNYTLNTGNATDTQVYTLVQSSLQMRLDQPSLQVKSYDDEPVTIKGYFFDANQNARVKPGRNQAQVTALVSFFVNGKPTGQADRITLTQQGDTFVGQTQVYGQIGQLHIEVTGNDDGVQRETSITIPLLPPLVCLDGFLKCSIERHVDILIPVLVFLIILILALIWLFKQSPSGWLRCSRNPNIAIELGTNRGIMQRLLHKSTITSDEIANHPDARACFKFQTNTSFKLVFVKGGKVYLVPTNGNSATIIVKPPAGSKKPAITLKGNTGKAELLPGSTVNINGQDRFSFHLSKGG